MAPKKKQQQDDGSETLTRIAIVSSDRFVTSRTTFPSFFRFYIARNISHKVPTKLAGSLSFDRGSQCTEQCLCAQV